MRQLDHENINRFVGLCVDAPAGALSLWRHNPRGSLRECIINSSKASNIDAFFQFCLMKDLLNGIDVIHKSSFLKFHGRLTSSCCLINEQWQVKISDYGISDLGLGNETTKLDLLWTAPELLRDNELGSKEGDIYSFGIICSEIATRETAWNGISDEAEAEDIIYKVKRGRTPWARPSMEKEAESMPKVVFQLITDCWAEHPDDRPSTEAVKTLMSSVKLSNKKDLMDHMLNVTEEYAANLEKEVEEKNREAVEERKRADVLLNRILPKQVAESLKAGKSVEPEAYDEVSIFFSDIVSFTVLAAKCSPLEVVTLLNALYTMFDSIIDEHDVYKVETIGDAYLCASGVPHRNGHEHGREIANMALSVVKEMKNFKVPHLPNEVVNVRVGMHTGPTVAGVVGATMPRYCLFGDTVTIATMMEHHGKPGMIQLSPEAHYLLTKVLGGFQTEARGELAIKGLGVLQTHWLLSSSR